MSEDPLAHSGVKGMQWGQRRNPDYSKQQEKRDTQIYGRGGAKRINKNLNKGDQISTARGAEKTRRDRVISKNKYVRQGGKVAGAVAGVAIANIGLNLIGKAVSTDAGGAFANKLLGTYGASLVVEASHNPLIRIAVSAGAAKVGNMLSGDAAVAANMRAHGYDPNRK